MQLSKLTFSLASLVVLIAFGLVFVTTPVMAHTPNTGVETVNHPHPLNEDQPDDEATTTVDEEVDAHGVHPRVTSIALKSVTDITSGTSVIVATNDSTTDPVMENQFTLIVTFDRDVASTGSIDRAGLATDANPLATTEFSEIVVDTTGVMQSGAASITSVSRVMDADDMVDNRKFEVVVTVSTFPTGTEAADDETLTYRVRVNAGTVFGLEATPAFTEVPGGANLESGLYTFTLVSALEPMEPPPGKKVTITPGAGIVATGAGAAGVGPGSSSLVFNLTTAAATDGMPTIAGTMNGAVLSNTDYLITGSGTAWTLTIVRSIGTQNVVITAGTGFEFHHAYPASATAAKVESFTVTVDRVGPTVVSIVESAGVLPTAGGAFQITVTFSETLSRMPVGSDFTVTNGAITAPFSQVSPTVFTTTLTPAHGVVGTNTDTTMQSVDIRLNTGLTDAFGNSSVATAATATADKSFTPLAATTAVVIAPGAPTGLTATADQEANTITLTWGAVSGAATYTVTKNYNMTDGTAATPVVKSGITGTTLTIPGATDDPLPQGVTFTFTVTATNSAGTSVASASATAMLTMDDVAPPLAFSGTIAPQTFTAGIALAPSLQLPTATGGSPPYKYSLHKGVGKLDITADGDNGLMVDLANLRVSGTPVATDTSGTSYTWRVTDESGEGSSLDLAFIVIVNPPGPNIAPVVAFTTPVPAIAQTGSFAIAYTATDADADTLTEVVTHTTAPLTAATSYTVTHDAMNKMVTITQATATVTTPSIPAAVVTVTITANDGTTGSTPMTFRVEFAAAIYDPGAPRDTTDPVVAVVPVVGDQSAAFDVTFTVIEANLATGGVTAAITPAEAVESAALVATHVSGNTYKVTVTPKMPTATTTSVAAATITITVTATDVASNSASQSIAVNLAARTYTPMPTDTTAPTVAVTPVLGAQSAAFDVTITATDDMDTLTAADISVTVTSSNTGAATYTVSAVTAGTAANTYKVTITPTAATTADIAAETLTVSVTVTDAASHSASQSIAVALAARSTTPTPVTPTVTDSANILSGFSIPAETHVVIARAGVRGLPSGVTLITWNGMPDLEGLLFSGGTLSLTRAKAPKVDHDNDDPEADGKKADSTTDASATRDIGTRDVVITEVMAALNTAVVGTDAAKAHQWIEVYNKLKVDVGGLTLSAKALRPAAVAAGAPTDEVLVDRLSNLVGGGWAFDNLGANGLTDNDDATTNAYFVSFYRNHRGEPGWQKSRWTTSTEVYLAGYKGSPGAKERASAPTISATNANRGPVIFNEISNNSNANHEWIELRNVSTGEVNLKKWEITLVTSKGANQANHNDVDFINFPDADRKVAAGGVLLIVAKDPTGDASHPLAGGWNIEKGANDQANGINANSARYIVLEFKGGGIPDGGEFVLVLRNRNDRNKSVNDNNIRDIAGYVPGAALKVDDGNLFTGLWPLKNFPQPNWSKNQLKSGEVHRRQFADIDGTKSKDKNQDDKAAFRNVGWTSVGYKRNAAANAQNGGTPGYPNNALQSNETQAGADPVVISEIMFATGTRANIPQWIELYNTSQTVGINLDGWRVTIVNHDQDADGEAYAGDLDKDYALSGKIPPGQTFLLVAYTGRNEARLPAERIYSLRDKRGELIMSRYGFEITLKTKGKDNKDANRKTADTVGNLAVVAVGAGRVRANPQSYEDPAWALPMGTNDDGDRISIVRASIKGDPMNGQLAAAWNSFDVSAQFVTTLDPTSYGHGTDISSPGHTVGGVLPVSLSKFRPERMKDTGEIVIRWVTESETNNAGFNILRSDARDGEFTKLNTKLIAGQGTTSERTVYEFPDTSAKPNVVYYYQIQDVSLDGQVQTLRTTHLRGNVTAAGKLTTTWGELKLQD